MGENYAHEMNKLNEAVESMKRERRLSGSGGELVEGESGGGAVEERNVKEKQQSEKNEERKKTRAASNTAGRPRSQSVDGVTFASSPMRPLETLMEHSPLNMFDEDDDTTKRPLEGILKEPSSNKRSR